MLSREKVEAVLFKMGMPANVKGFGYIVDSVLLLEEDSKIKTTYLYFKVAQQHGTTGQRVERAIRHAFDIVRSCRGDYDVVNHYIGFINCANSPSLSMLTMKIREEALEVPEPKPEKKEETEETEEQKAEKSLEAFRQSMEGTLQNFGVAFLGEVDESYVDRIPEWIEENFPDLSEEYPFVKMIPEERIIASRFFASSSVPLIIPNVIWHSSFSLDVKHNFHRHVPS